MSSKKIYGFPRVTDKLINEIGLQCTEPTFSYYEKGKEYALQYEQKEESANTAIKLSDSRERWNHKEHELRVCRTYTIQNPAILFGPSGIVPYAASVGIAVLYTSSDSRQRGSIPFCSFNHNDSVDSVCFDTVFAPGMFRGSVSFKTILYVSHQADIWPDEGHLANKEGYRLGTVDEFTVLFDGNGSWFPIYNRSMPGKPLWDVEYSALNPSQDKFNEAVSITLNTAHPEYRYLNSNHKTVFNRQLQIEVIASAMYIIIQSFCAQPEEWEKAVQGEDFEEGSVTQMISYLIKTYDLDFKDPQTLSLSLRKMLEEIL